MSAREQCILLRHTGVSKYGSSIPSQQKHYLVGSLSDNTSHKKTAVWASLNSMMDVINLDVDTLELLYLITALQIRTGQRSINVNLWPLTAHICHVMIMVTGGFSKKSLLFSEPVVPRCSSK